VKDLYTPQHVKDRNALDDIAELLSGEEWNPETLNTIADLVRETGRDIDDLDASLDACAACCDNLNRRMDD
jgi:hypothetical protein